MTIPPRLDEDRAQWISNAVETYESKLITYTARLTGDDSRARDVVQDAFLRLWQADAASVNGHLAPWLYRVCRNRALDVMRKESRMTALDAINSHAPPGELGFSSETCSDRETAESSRAAMQLLNTLPVRQQEVLRLKLQGDLSYKEIAEVMNLTVSNVGFLIHTALRTLREKISGTTDSGGEAAHSVAG